MTTDNQLPATLEPEYGDDFQDAADIERELLLSQMSGEEKRRFSRQDTVLRYVAQDGDPEAGCFVARVSVRTHNRWLETDVLGYRGRMREAEKMYAHSLERLAVKRVKNPEGNRGGDTLLIALNNANNPEKWRGSTTTLELSDELRDFMQKRQVEDQSARAALPEVKVLEHKATGDEPGPWEGE